jgi:hypothetical protein
MWNEDLVTTSKGKKSILNTFWTQQKKKRKTYAETSWSGKGSYRKLGMLYSRSVLEHNWNNRTEHAYKIIKLLYHGCEKWTKQQLPLEKPTIETEFF